MIESLRNFNFEFAAICLQETWLDQNADLSLLQLTNYQCISQGKHCSQHGGLIIYLHDMFTYKTHISFKSDTWEGQFIKVKLCNENKYICIAKIYRPPKDSNSSTIIETFIEELDPIITDLNKSNFK